MYHDSDLDAGIKAGILSPDSATALRNLAAARRDAPAADEEYFGLALGMADILAAVALLILTVSAGFALALAIGPFAVPFVAIGTVGASEYFILKRRFALTSYLLFAFFAVSWACTMFGIALLLDGISVLGDHGPASTATISPAAGLLTSGGCAMGCGIFWLRFKLPIAYAAAAVAGLNFVIHLLRVLAPNAPTGLVSSTLLLLGVILFLLAMWWDMTDVRRQTARSQIGFWLHAAAGYQIANAAFRLVIGLQDHPQGWERLYSVAIATPTPAATAATLVVATVFMLIALAIDRRSLLMASLFFVVPALAHISGPEQGALLLALGLGAFLLILATCWTWLRAAVLAKVPVKLRAQFPRTEIAARRRRPVD